jgi:hypothetical protein
MNTVQFSNEEIRAMRIWGDTVINGGHWGNGQVLFPDEEMALTYIDTLEAGLAVKISNRMAKILLIWADKAAMISPEEQMLVEKLKVLAARTPA